MSEIIVSTGGKELILQILSGKAPLFRLRECFLLAHTPQGLNYWRRFVYDGVPLDDEARAILEEISK